MVVEQINGVVAVTVGEAVKLVQEAIGQARGINSKFDFYFLTFFIKVENRAH